MEHTLLCNEDVMYQPFVASVINAATTSTTSASYPSYVHKRLHANVSVCHPFSTHRLHCGLILTTRFVFAALHEHYRPTDFPTRSALYSPLISVAYPFCTTLRCPFIYAAVCPCYPFHHLIAFAQLTLCSTLHCPIVYTYPYCEFIHHAYIPSAAFPYPFALLPHFHDPTSCSPSTTL